MEKLLNVLRPAHTRKVAYNMLLGILLLLLFHLTYGINIINPKNIGWLMDAYHDWGTHYLGWAFYRNDPWTFPLGDITTLYYPIGTNVGLTDSIPLLAFIFKVFSPLLSNDFQYFGLWLLLCHFLLAYYTQKIFKLYNVNKIIAFFGIIIIAFNPVIIYRAMHPSLCAHFLIAASIYIYIRSLRKQQYKKDFIYQSVLLLVSAMINPYITFIIAGFSVILIIKQYKLDKVINIKVASIYLFFSFFSVLIFWILFGMINFNSSGISAVSSIESIKDFGFNLNSFFNSMGYSKFIDQRPLVRPQQYEGFAYLGVGMIILIIVAFIKFAKKLKHIKANYALLFALIMLLFIFSISNQITFDDKIILEYPIPHYIDRIAAIFRASGRMVWPLYYLLMFFSIIFISQLKLKKSFIAVFVFLISVLQFYDIQTLISQRKLRAGSYDTPLNDSQWVKLMTNFDYIITYPLYDLNLKYASDYQDLCYLALKANKPITNGYVARNKNPHKTETFRKKLEKELVMGEIGNELYVFMPGNFPKFSTLAKDDKIVMQQLDGYFIVYSKKFASKVPIFNESNKQYIKSILDSCKTHNTVEFAGHLIPSQNIKYNIDSFDFSQNVLAIRGWAFPKSAINSRGTVFYITLKNKEKSYIIQLQSQKRSDLVEVYKKDYEDAGFNSTILMTSLPLGKYDLGLLIKHNDKDEYFTSINQTIEIR